MDSFFSFSRDDRVRRNAGLAEGSASRAASAEERTAVLVKHYEHELAKLRVANRAIWELIKQRTDLTDDDLRAMFESLLDDETALQGPQVVECAQCGRVVGRRQSECLYCGTPRPTQPL